MEQGSDGVMGAATAMPICYLLFAIFAVAGEHVLSVTQHGRLVRRSLGRSIDLAGVCPGQSAPLGWRVAGIVRVQVTNRRLY